jgi:glycosyltransferase involved in cell wall biosynthesis
MRKKICLVTEELAYEGQTGGIGGAFLELALLLADRHDVDILYCPLNNIGTKRRNKMGSHFSALGISIRFLAPELYSWGEPSPSVRSYGVFRNLLEYETEYDVIHFHEYKGLGFYTLSARDQGIAFWNATFVVQLHGPTRWTIESNDSLFTHDDQLKIDFLERETIARADYAVSPSEYLFSWLRRKKWKLPAPVRCLVIKNVCSSLLNLPGVKRNGMEFLDTNPREKRHRVSEIVIFCRHEYRKGFTIACDVLDQLNKRLSDEGIRVTFLGNFGVISDEHSGVILARKARRWKFPIAVLPNFDRNQAAEYLSAHSDAIVVIPSPIENSPYTVLEAIALGKPIITSRDGGAKELLADIFHEQMLCEMTAEGLATALEDRLEHGMESPILAESLAETERRWISFHDTANKRDAFHPVTSHSPLVSLCITHFSRVNKLVEAIASVAKQTYPNIELIVVDDGSPSTETQKALDDLEQTIDQLNGKLVRRKNGYLGAARNTAAAVATGEYLCFLDDDDIAFPQMVEELVRSALHTGADIVNCLNIFMPEARRQEAWPLPQLFKNRVSYHPLGGPLSLVTTENTLGAATALISRHCFDKVGGYTEVKGVGHEDYEFFARALQIGCRIEICPLPLYLYEVDRPSMVSSTSATRNYKRVVDAIDFSENAAAWSDLAHLNTGKIALERGRARKTYMQSNDPNAAILSAIDSSASPQALLRHLAEYAYSLESPGIERAFRQAAELQAEGANSKLALGGDQDDGVLMLRHFLCAGNDEGAKTSLTDVRSIEMLHSSPVKFANRVCRDLATSKFVASPVIVKLRLLMGVTLPNQNVREILDTIIECETMKQELPLLLEAVLIFALQIKDVEVSSRSLAHLIQIDGEEYLRLNVDVAEAVANRSIASPLVHYIEFGFAEKRSGFDRVESVLKILKVLRGLDLLPSQLVALAEGKDAVVTV